MAEKSEQDNGAPEEPGRDEEPSADQGRKWWELEKLVSPGGVNLMLWCLAGTTALFLVLAIVCFFAGSGSGSAPRETRAEVKTDEGAVSSRDGVTREASTLEQDEGTVPKQVLIDKEIARLERELALSKEHVRELDLKLAEFPKTPLPAEDAGRRYREIVKEVGSIESHADRVERCLRAKLELAGTKFESKAHKLWKGARDAAARAIYDKATATIKSQPEMHDLNIQLLIRALKEVVGTRYEKSIRKLIDSEHNAMAAKARRDE